MYVVCICMYACMYVLYAHIRGIYEYCLVFKCKHVVLKKKIS